MENPADAVVPRYQELTYELAAGEEVTIATDATIFTALAATADFGVAFNGQPATNFKQGLSYRAPAPLRSVRLVNTGGSVNTVTVGIARGDIRDQRLSLNSAVQVENVPGEVIEVEGAAAGTPLWVREPESELILHQPSAGNATATMILPANPNRKSLLITNRASYDFFLVPDASWTAWTSPYIELGQDESLELRSQDAIYGCFNGAVRVIDLTEEVYI